MGELSADEYLYKGLDIDCWGGADYFYNKGGMHNMTRLFAGFFGPQYQMQLRVSRRSFQQSRPSFPRQILQKDVSR
jgi:hypothetical protein